ncbi:sodium:calcium antiporter [Halorubellus sp. JP-L1]|uniref:sodium:calcium antiporter n=1 Tax=Halorubellus sp. JP-L1 TaxID=2715753 RepID=UPI00140BE1DF|nr:sodium:calcium antiporter [Halorubellus sp. JP-L1]NHN42397.1 sodium:calcium antiporter [Halorubellus sp. JP-L1]
MLKDRLRHPLVALALAALLTAPWVTVELVGGPDAVGLGNLSTVAVSGVAVLGASFMLAWGAETAEKDVPRAFAIAVLAVLAVAPEYAVDALYAWQAGSGGATEAACSASNLPSQTQAVKDACHDANLAIANMTGANRILIGLGWSGIALFTVYRAGSERDSSVERSDGFLASKVHLDRDIGLEIAFLLVATVFAFTVPFLGGIDVIDTVVLLGLYVAYIAIIVRGDVEEHEEQVGVPAYLQRRPFPVRALTSITLFAYSGLMIYTAVHPFAHGLEEVGLAYNIPEFFMIQWVAPLASESPELIVVAYLVNKARSTAGFNALISSKLNQWTLLVGTLAVVYSIASGSIGTLPFDEKQAAEIWITAAQSLFAIAIITNFEISVREAVMLLVLFVSQVAMEYVVIITTTSVARETELSIAILYAYTVLYLAISLGLFWYRRRELAAIFVRSARTARYALGNGTAPAEGAD